MVTRVIKAAPSAGNQSALAESCGPYLTTHSFFLRTGQAKNRWDRYVRLALTPIGLCWLTIFNFSVGATTFPARATHDAGALAAHKASLQRWLAQVDLSRDLKVEKLRWGSDPAPKAAENQEALRLELRFLTNATDQNTEDKRFNQFLDRYQTAYGETALERVFYKLIHECQVGPQEAVITIRVVERDHVVFFDPATAELLMQFKADRSIPKEVPLQLPRAASAGRLQTSLGTSNAPDRRALTGLIDSFVRDYFTAANRQAHLSGPKFAPDGVENRDRDHVGFIVSGIKSQVLTTKNYWEEIEISIDVVEAPSGLKLVCHIDGYYAGGVGSKLPDEEAYEDMRKGYQGQLQTFVDGFLSRLQNHIETGSP